MIIVSSLISQIAGAIFLCPPNVIEQSLPMYAPLVKSMPELKERQDVDRILESAWKDCDGYQVQLCDEWLVNGENLLDDTKIGPSTYGEVTSLGARQLFQNMGMREKRKSNLVFFDLGSGAGKLVVQSFLELPGLSKCVGVELSPSRHECATSAWEKVQQEVLFKTHPSQSTVTLIQGDLFQADLSEATHIFVSSLCFTPEMIKKLGLKLKREAPCLEYVASLTQLQNLGEPRVCYIEMSWTKPRGSPVYFYVPGK